MAGAFILLFQNLICSSLKLKALDVSHNNKEIIILNLLTVITVSYCDIQNLQHLISDIF